MLKGAVEELRCMWSVCWHGRKVPGRGAAVLGTECTLRQGLLYGVIKMEAKNNLLAVDCQCRNSTSLSASLWLFSRQKRAGNQSWSWLWASLCKRVAQRSCMAGLPLPGSVQPAVWGQHHLHVMQPPFLHKESCESELKHSFEADPCYQVRLKIGGEWEHLERYRIDFCRHLTC